MSADFLDSNILLYLTSGERSKAELVEDLLADRPVISSQVLNEITNVLRRKVRFDWVETNRFVDRVISLTTVLPITSDTNISARQVAERYRFAVYDSVVVASALEGGCARLLTEDLHHSQRIGDLTITNPFR
jgi:predicted nucleic acid-binding protein